MADVPVVRTTYSMKDFAKACILAWKRVVGVFPKKEAAGIIWAQHALETGNGGFCWNNNIGNLKCTKEQAAAGVPYMMLAGTWEMIDGKKVVFQPPHPSTWFRAFASLDEGMSAHLDLLKNKRYATAWPSVESGEPAAFAAALRARGYYTASVEDYTRLMKVGFAQWMQRTAFEDAQADVLEALEADTNPELPATEPEPFQKVRGPIPFARPELDADLPLAMPDDEPPDAA
jgi:hypothetical protein